MTIQRHIGVHMSDEEYKQVDPADEVAFRSPVPTQIVSNGEYNPLPQTNDQAKVEGLIKEMGDYQAKRNGMDRRSTMACGSKLSCSVRLTWAESGASSSSSCATLAPEFQGTCAPRSSPWPPRPWWV